MSWFPTFLNPLTALIAAAIAIPSLLLLYFLKLRRREVAVSSTILWRKAIQDLQVNSPFQKLRKNLLLLLQMLLLIALLLALSRPMAKLAATAGKTSVILIDRSASMSAPDVDGGTRLDEAKRRARDLVNTMGRGSSAMVIAFDDVPQTMQPFTSDAQALRNAIDSIQPTDRKSRLQQAYQLADAQVQFLPEQNRTNKEPPDVWLYSDGRIADPENLRLTGNLKYEKLGSDDTSNIAVVAVSARRNYERPTEVQVFARLASFGPQPVEAPVQLSVAAIDPADPTNLNFQVNRVAGTSLVPDRWGTDKREQEVKARNLSPREGVEFTLELDTGAVLKIEQTNTDGDGLAADDVAYVVVPPPRNLAVLYVDGGDGNPFIERALDSLDLKDMKRLTPQQYEAQIPTEFDVIVFDRYSPTALPPAGNFVYLGGVPPNTKLTAETKEGKRVVAEGGEVLDWKRDHPILRHLVLSKLYAAEMLSLQPPLDAEVLIEGVNGPMLVLYREGRGTHLVVSFDTLQSNWPTRPSFPVFVYNAMQFLALGTDMNVRQAYDPGASPVIPAQNLQRAGESVRRVRLNGPGGSREIDVPPTGEFALPPLNQAGIYTLTPAVPQFEQIAVNLVDPSESNLLPVDTAPGGVGEAVATTSGPARTELWWWIIACVGVPLLMIEWWVYTRRVHL
ncbi:MAG TPA: VWA domain-containing protein [Tepidisphaeraceae bacterium]|jgi:hypothetical protein|nr:VWA domain-containing protein [Tepidisphaeraceae bacterium]